MSVPAQDPGDGRGRRPARRADLLLKAFHEEEALGQTYDIGLLRRLLPFARAHLWLFGTALALMPVAATATLLQPYLLKRAIDAAVLHHSRAEVFRIAMLFLATIVGEFIARFAQTYTMQLAGQRTMADVRRAVFRHAQKLRVGYFDRTPIGRIVTRVTNDVDALGEVFASGAVTAVGDLLMLVGVVAFMLYLDWRLSLLAFAALPPLAIAVEFFRRFAREAYRSIRAKTAQLNAYLSEQVQGVAVVQAFGREDLCADEYRRINDAYRDANYRSIKYDALLYSMVEAVGAACVAIVLWYASVRAGLVTNVAGSAAYIGTVVAFYEYIQRFFVPIRDLSTKYTIIQASLASAERIFGLLDVQDYDAPEQNDVPVRPSPRAGSDGAIAFREVVFGYRPGDAVLKGMGFEVRRGEKIAIVGATGAGKTTVMSLLLRLYDVQGGSVLVDGRDVRTYDRATLRRKFAVVPQDVFLFSGTVLDNVTVGAGTVDEARAIDALRRVGAWDLLERREGGLRAQVAERGANFSAGERQLIAFARALYRDAPNLLLDEATANVDSETEARLQAAVEELLVGRTAIIVAHRLSTIERADRILVFHHGEIVEEGTHRELLAKAGVYARLHALQFADPARAGAGA